MCLHMFFRLYMQKLKKARRKQTTQNRKKLNNRTTRKTGEKTEIQDIQPTNLRE